jgi:hypothetical protein
MVHIDISRAYSPISIYYFTRGDGVAFTQTIEDIPTQPSSMRIGATAIIKIISRSKTTEMTRHVTCAALDGVEKNRRTTRSRANVKVV